MEISIGQRGQYWDSQAVAQFAIWRQLDDSPMRDFALRWLEDRLEKLTAGRAMAGYHRSVERKIQEVDPNLRLRWEFDAPEDPNGMYAVDRYVPEYGYHFTIFFWSHTLGEGGAMRQVLTEGDMQRPEFHKAKKLVQELALERNSKMRTEMALHAVDMLTDKQCREFVEVERALRSGEKIRSYGRDAEILNRMYENTKRMAVLGVAPPHAVAINPGHNPIGFGAKRERS